MRQSGHRRGPFDDGGLVDLAHCIAFWVRPRRGTHVLDVGTACLPYAPPAADSSGDR